ncbi:OpgC domain-containing protein [Bradyrhizobium sp. URHC0002]
MDRFVSAVCASTGSCRVTGPGLEWPIFRTLIKCGLQSLEVFRVGVFLAVGAHVVLDKISDAVWMQIAVSVLGIAMLTGFAYCRSWCKKVDKPNSLAVRRPSPRQTMCRCLGSRNMQPISDKTARANSTACFHGLSRQVYRYDYHCARSKILPRGPLANRQVTRAAFAAVRA